MVEKYRGVSFLTRGYAKHWNELLGWWSCVTRSDVSNFENDDSVDHVQRRED